MKKIILPAFIILALVQWLVPGKIIWNREEILQKGKAWHFESAPVDPSNPFLGKFIALNFKEQEFIMPVKVNFITGQDIFVLLIADKNGFAKIAGLAAKEPESTTDFLKAKISYSYIDSGKTDVRLDYPFEGFYMDEYKAPAAEKIYNQSVRDSTQRTYAVVKVWKGKPVIENVFIGNTPIGYLIKAE
jgi:uncharacterized membrane-anchored protein